MNIFVSFVGYYELPLVIELPFALSVARHACLDEKKFPENTVKRPFFFKKKTKPRTYFSEARKISKKKETLSLPTIGFLTESASADERF